MARRKGEVHAPSLPDSDSADDTLQSLAEQCRLECARAEIAEAERDEWKQAAEVEAGLRREFKAERDAIEAKTIERCAQVVDQCNHEGPYNAIGAASRIRALPLDK